MSDKSLPDEGVQPTGSQDDLPVDNPNPSADEQQDAVSGGKTQDADQDPKDEPQKEETPRPKGDSSNADDEDGLAKFAKSRGYDFSDLNDREKKILNDAYENQKAFRQERQEKKQTNDLQKNLQEAIKPDEEELENESPAVAEMRRTQAMVAQLQSQQRVTDFYMNNPEARDFDKEMGELVKEEAKERGADAARYLAADLERLLLLAKARKGTDSTEAIEAARREERESLRRKQEGAGETPAAQTRNSGTNKVTREWVQNEYDPKNPEHQALVDEAMSRGDLY